MSEYEQHIHHGDLKPDRSPSEYEALRSELDRIQSSMLNYAGAVDRYAEVVNEQVAALWVDNAELRDELHAVANRLESLTRAITTSPAEVAAAIVNDANRGTLREVFTCRLNPGCNVSRPHIHDDDGAVIYVEDEATADDQLRQRALAVGLRRARGQS